MSGLPEIRDPSGIKVAKWATGRTLDKMFGIKAEVAISVAHKLTKRRSGGEPQSGRRAPDAASGSQPDQRQ